MYKSGKQWVIAAIATVTAGLMLTAGGSSANAATTDSEDSAAVVTTVNADKNSNPATTVNDSQQSSKTSQTMDEQTDNSAVSNKANGVASNTTVTASHSDIQTAVSEKNAAATPKTSTGWNKNAQGQNVYYQNGKPLAGQQYVNLPTIPNTGAQGNTNWYLMKDGVAQSGVQQWAGTYYYFDPSSYLRVDNDYRQSQWGDWYLFGKDGRIQTGVQQWAGTYYYFDPVTYLRVDNDYRQSQWGMWYMFGPDGRIVTGQKEWYGNTYYFDPTTYLKVTNKWVDGKYYGPDGAQAISKLLNIDGNLYYFDDQGQQVANQFKTINGETYYFGSDKAAVTGRQWINGKVYNFSSRGILLGNRYGKIVNGKFNIYNLADNSLLKTIDEGPWENMAYSLDSSSINNIDGYISYTGWYRPYGTSQDGKTWYRTSAADWRPILMYAWPSKDVQAQFIKYFVNHGYQNSDYNLTAETVKDLSGDTATNKLDNMSQNLRYVIEQHIVSAKSTGPLANDINGFMATIPALSK